MLHFVKVWNQKNNMQILDELGLVIDGRDNNKEADNIPLTKLHEFNKMLEEALTVKKEALVKSTLKSEQFNKRTKEIIKKSASVYKNVLRECDSELEFAGLLKDIINPSISRKMEKEDFSNELTNPHVNFDEVLAETLVSEFYHLYSLSFYKHKKRHFTINSDEMFTAMNRLIGEKRKEYIVIVFGLQIGRAHV